MQWAQTLRFNEEVRHLRPNRISCGSVVAALETESWEPLGLEGIESSTSLGVLASLFSF